jgi:hypothetical protein
MRGCSILLLFLFSGCAAYHVGNRSLYAPDVSTVYVPVIESDSFRRDLGERLTEAVSKEIELKTPFKVVGSPNADSVLAVHLRNDQRFLLFENAYDNPRALEVDLRADVTWVNRRRMPLIAPEGFPVPPALVPFGQTSTLIAEGGQSVTTAQQQAIQRLAEQIVGAMEEPW